jgi:hypothetical protein
MPDLTVRVVTANQRAICCWTRKNDGVLGGEGADDNGTQVGQYADGLLSPGESVNVPFALCLKTFNRFSFSWTCSVS